MKTELEIVTQRLAAMKTLYHKHFISKNDYQNTVVEVLKTQNQVKHLELEIKNHQQNKYLLVKAPVTGIVTNILLKKGQFVSSSQPLLQVIPEHSQLIAQLNVPTHQIGFLKKGDSVYLKYDAFPAEHFGMYKAVIKEISLNVLTDSDEKKPIRVGQPYYKISAQLDKTQLVIHGEKKPLIYGMTLTGIIPGEKRKIWQWIFKS